MKHPAATCTVKLPNGQECGQNAERWDQPIIDSEGPCLHYECSGPEKHKFHRPLVTGEIKDRRCDCRE